MRPKALLLTIHRDNREMEELAFSLGLDVVATLFQNRSYPDADTYLGRGKLEEARELARSLGVARVLVAGSLKPNQVFGLTTFFREDAPNAGRRRVRDETEPIEVLDRIGVILEIFKERANSPEARLQVELARLRYEVPLVKEQIHRLKSGERAGFLAGGRYEVEQYHDLIKRRMTRARAELEKIRRERDVRRKHRRRGGFHLVSLAGYTNAGKSSLLRALAGADALVENRYFSTLGTMTRRVRDEHREILLTDTVGFIEDLPPWLVEAFHSTLEEIALADLILLVLDASDPIVEMRRKIRASLRVLWDFQAPRGTGDLRRPATPVVVVFNKADLVEETTLAERIGTLLAEGLIDEHYVVASARTRAGLAELQERIRRALPGYLRIRAMLPAGEEGGRLLALLHEDADPSTVERLADGRVRVEAEIRQETLPTLEADILASGGSVERETPPLTVVQPAAPPPALSPTSEEEAAARDERF